MMLLMMLLVAMVLSTVRWLSLACHCHVNTRSASSTLLLFWCCCIIMKCFWWVVTLAWCFWRVVTLAWCFWRVVTLAWCVYCTPSLCLQRSLTEWCHYSLLTCLVCSVLMMSTLLCEHRSFQSQTLSVLIVEEAWLEGFTDEPAHNCVISCTVLSSASLLFVHVVCRSC